MSTCQFIPPDASLPHQICRATGDGLQLTSAWDTAEDEEYLLGSLKTASGGVTAAQALEAMRRQGPQGWNKLEGGFAIVWLQRRTGQVSLATDRFAFSELFFAAQNGKLVFAPSLSALLALPELSRELSPAGLSDYLGLGYVTAPTTIYRQIWRVPSATACTFDAGSTTPHLERFWRPDYTARESLSWEQTLATAKDKIRNLLTSAMQGRKAAVLLSGGIDSSLLTALSCDLGCPPAAAFTASYGDALYDEGSLAAQVAARYHLPHRECRVTPDALASVLKLQREYGEPFADSSLLALSALLREVKDAGFDSVLCGDGGDELFGGYRRYQAMLWRHSLGGVPAALGGLTGKLLLPLLPSPRDNRSRLANFTRSLRSLTLPPIQAYTSFQELFSREMRQQLLVDCPATDFLATWQDEAKIITVKDRVELYNGLDLLHYLPEDGCRKGLVANLQTQVTCLMPLLSASLLDWAMTLPRQYKTTRQATKFILRTIGADYLPEPLLARRKTGFGIPLAAWLRGPWSDQLRWLVEDAPQWDANKLFNHQFIKRLVEEHLEGRANHDARLWSLLLLAHWRQEN